MSIADETQRSVRIHWLMPLGLLCLLVSGCANPQTAKKRYLESGLRFLNSGKYEESAIQFRNALRIDSRYVEAYYQLGQAHMANRDWHNAYSALQQGTALDGSRLDFRLSLARLYLAAREFDKADAEITAILAREPNNYAAYDVRGSVAILQQRYPEALEAFEKMIQLQPSSAAPLINVGLVHIARREYADAESVLKKAVQVEPDSTDACLNLANLYRLLGKLSLAEATSREGLGRHPDSIPLNILVADLLLAQNRHDAAVALLEGLAGRKQHAAEVSLSVGDFFVSRLDLAHAAAEYALGLKASPKNIALKLRMVESYITDNRIDDAEALNAQVLAAKPKDVMAGIARGRILLARGKVDDSIEVLTTEVKEAPESAHAHYFLGVALESKRSLEQARNELRKALDFSPGLLPARQHLVGLLVEAGEFTEARRLSETAVGSNPSGWAERLMLGSVCLRQNDLAHALEHLSVAQRVAPRDPFIALQIAAVFAAGRRWADAEKEFQRAVRLAPDSLDVMARYADFLSSRDQSGRAIAQAGEYVDKHPANPRAHLFQGSLLIKARQYDRARVELRQAIQLDSKLAQAHLLLAQLQRSTGDTAGAATEYETALAERPGSAALHTEVGNLYLETNQVDLARKHFERAVALDPNYPAGAANLAWVDSHQNGNLDVALGLAQRAHYAQPDALPIADTLAWVLYRKGVYDAALPLFRECAGKEPATPVYRYHLGLALVAIGDRNKGRSELQAALRLRLDGSDAEQARQVLEGLR